MGGGVGVCLLWFPMLCLSLWEPLLFCLFSSASSPFSPPFFFWILSICLSFFFLSPIPSLPDTSPYCFFFFRSVLCKSFHVLFPFFLLPTLSIIFTLCLSFVPPPPLPVPPIRVNSVTYGGSQLINYPELVIAF